MKKKQNHTTIELVELVINAGGAIAALITSIKWW